ncbi:hypothetical protein KTJ32_18645 [Acinetobacter gyllenbergii]|uniref:hypothetical protein n=1 Tax=Acinetobacter gyllenbergii TaxID=134534 RepID=UPI000806AC96|nr:hypothetical protein [Acinetobacter gyllenbergii]MCU4583015.1 hypothetical protein [Acinetobacter gyllenbergii]OBY75536.1 hypothetical protein NG55_02350 [Acinetobacter gyllenbergii]
MNSKQKIVYRNTSKDDLKLILEPWGGETIISPNSEIDIIIDGDHSLGYLEFEYDHHTVIIYGWQGSIIRIYENGKEVL